MGPAGPSPYPRRGIPGWAWGLIAGGAGLFGLAVVSIMAIAFLGSSASEEFVPVGPGGPAPVSGSYDYDYGDDPQLDGLWDDCFEGDDAACVLLWYQSPALSGYETFAATCGGRVSTPVEPPRCASDPGTGEFSWLGGGQRYLIEDLGYTEDEAACLWQRLYLIVGPDSLIFPGDFESGDWSAIDAGLDEAEAGCKRFGLFLGLDENMEGEVDPAGAAVAEEIIPYTFLHIAVVERNIIGPAALCVADLLADQGWLARVQEEDEALSAAIDQAALACPVSQGWSPPPPTRTPATDGRRHFSLIPAVHLSDIRFQRTIRARSGHH